MRIPALLIFSIMGTWLVGWAAPTANAPPGHAPPRRLSTSPRPPPPKPYAKARAALATLGPKLRVGVTVQWANHASVLADTDDIPCIAKVKILHRFAAPRQLPGVGALPPLVTFIGECVGTSRSVFHLALVPAGPRSGRPLRMEPLFTVPSKLKSARAVWSRGRRGVALYSVRVVTVDENFVQHHALHLFSLVGRKPAFLKEIKLQNDGSSVRDYEKVHQLARWIHRKTAPFAVLAVSTRVTGRVETPAPHMSCEYELSFFVLGAKGYRLQKAPSAVSDTLENDPRVQRLVPRKGFFFCGNVSVD